VFKVTISETTRHVITRHTAAILLGYVNANRRITKFIITSIVREFFSISK